MQMHGTEIALKEPYRPKEKSRFLFAYVLLLLLSGLTPHSTFAQQPVIQVLYSFVSSNGIYTYGRNPAAGLTLGPDGALYGTTLDGGTNGNFGTIFRITTDGALTTLASFDGTNGSYPQASLTLGNDGNFYGTASEGGTNGGYGTVFEVTTNGILTAIASFANTNGAIPLSSLALAQDGNFYGTTSQGGNGLGVTYRVTSDGTLTALRFFPDDLPGAAGKPYGGLVSGSDGALYGTTSSGGPLGYGTVFSMTTNGVITPLALFAGTNGSNPAASLTQGNDGAFYGTTASGGTNGGNGTVFQVTTNGSINTLASFNSTNGADPVAPLTLGSDGAFYGTTYIGGVNNSGTVFRVTTNGTLTTLASFTGPNGSFPTGGLTQASDGDFYGTTSSSGSGEVFALRFPPGIATQPLSQTNVAGTNSSFTVAATGSRTLQYQWREDGTNLVDGLNLSGTATPTLVISNTQPADAGNYDVIITNAYGSITSIVATLTVVVPPNITSNPQGLTNTLGTTASFSVSVTGDPPLTYQWQEDGVDIVGATNSTYTIPSLEAADAGNYDVIVSNLYGASVSQPAVLDVTVPGLAWRTLHTSFAPGEVVTVELDITPPPGTTNWGLAEFYPSDWTVVSAPDASATNDLTGELDFGPFTNAQPETIIYQVASIFELTNSAVFSGQVWFDGVTNDIGGYTSIPALKQWTFVGPQSLPGGFDVSGAGYGAGRWVATAWGWSTTLADGSPDWSYPIGQAPFANDWSRMAFLNQKFLWWGRNSGVPEIALLAASDDGLAWKAARPSTNGVLFSNPQTQGPSLLESAAYGNGLYVVVGFQGTNIPTQGGSWQGAIWVSSDAYQWTQIYQLLLPDPGNATRSLHAIAFGGGTFIAVGDLGTVVTSSDGTNWTETQDPLGLGASNPLTNANQYLGGIAYGPEGWIALKSGNTDNRELCSTNNGTNWFYITATGAPPVPAPPYYFSFYADGKYWFTGETGSYFTSDGTTWTPVSLGAIRRAPDGVSPLYLGGQSGALYGSEDGSNWTTVASAPSSAYWNNYQTIMPSGTGWLLSGLPCGGILANGWAGPLNSFTISNAWGWVPNYALDSANWFADTNLNWSQQSTPVFGDYLAYNGRLLAAGVNGNASVTLMAASINPSNQTFQATSFTNAAQSCPFQPYRNIKALNGGAWGYLTARLAPSTSGVVDLYEEAASFNGGGSSVVNWAHYFTMDGTNWCLRSPGLNDITQYPGIRGIAWGAGEYVAVALGSAPGVNSTTNRIFTSVNGQNYTPLPLTAVSPPLGSEGLTGVGFNAGAFVAIGNQGRILYSSDGMNWQSSYGSDGFGWNRLRYLNNIWWAVGGDGRVASSTTGTNWTITSTGVTNSLNDIASVRGYYMVVGDNSMVLYSIFHAPQPPQIVPGSLIFGNGAFQFTVQTDPNVLPVVEASQDLVNWTTNLSLTHTATNSTGLVTFTDSGVGSYPRRFYRALLP